MMAGNETTRRRRVQGRSAGALEVSSTDRTGRSNSTSGHDQQSHHHHHDHHHHHYHYHHHYHHFPRPFITDQEQSLLLSAGGVAAPGESLSQADPNHTEHQHRLTNSRPAFMNDSQSGMFSHEAANEDRDRLDERLRAAVMQSHRPSFRGILEEFSFLFGDDDDSWSDDEVLERIMQELPAAVGFQEAVQSHVHSLLEQGLSKSLIRRLKRVVFVPEVPRTDMGVVSDSSEQDDCSVCLEHFVAGQQLICLPCRHRFHSNCLIPWLESHAKCPYCRARVSFDGTGAASSSQSANESAVSLIEDDLIAWMETIDSELSQLNVR